LVTQVSSIAQKVISLFKTSLIANWWIYLIGFEIQELPDVIRVIVLLNLSKGVKIKKSTLKSRIDRVCVSYTCVEMPELDKTLKEMSGEGLSSKKMISYS
jgi:hypothetical protein